METSCVFFEEGTDSECFKRSFGFEADKAVPLYHVITKWGEKI
jgi:hypothetical protein